MPGEGGSSEAVLGRLHSTTSPLDVANFHKVDLQISFSGDSDLFCTDHLWIPALPGFREVQNQQACSRVTRRKVIEASTKITKLDQVRVKNAAQNKTDTNKINCGRGEAFRHR